MSQLPVTGELSLYMLIPYTLPDPLVHISGASDVLPAAYMASCTWLGISATVSVCVSDPPVLPTFRVPLPMHALPPRFGRLKVVDPFPDPHAVPIAAKSLGYWARLTAEPSHSR